MWITILIHYVWFDIDESHNQINQISSYRYECTSFLGYFHYQSSYDYTKILVVTLMC